MDREAIEKIRERRYAAMKRQEENYQVTGDGNFYRKMKGHELVVDLCDQALRSVEDHQTAVALKIDIVDIASLASKAEYHAHRAGEYDRQEVEKVLREVMAVARRYGWTNRYE